MSTPKSSNPLEAQAPVRAPVSHRKPKADLYTLLLVIALIAVLLGILFLYLNMKRYDFKLGPGVAAAAAREFGGQERQLARVAPAGQAPTLRLPIARFS